MIARWKRNLTTKSCAPLKKKKKNAHHKLQQFRQTPQGHNLAIQFTNKTTYPIHGVRIWTWVALLPASLERMDWLASHPVTCPLWKCSIFETPLHQLYQQNSATGACAEPCCRTLLSTSTCQLESHWCSQALYESLWNHRSKVDGFAEWSSNVCFPEGFCNSLWNKEQDRRWVTGSIVSLTDKCNSAWAQQCSACACIHACHPVCVLCMCVQAATHFLWISTLSKP